MEFVVLPDCRDAELVTARFHALTSTKYITHPSGRPWLVGDWSEDEITTVTAGDIRLVVLGRTLLDTTSITGLLYKAECLEDLDTVARRLPGLVHLCASLGRRSRVQGAISTARQVFFTQVGPITVAASSPGPLARLTGAGLDDEVLATRLMTPSGPPWPLSGRCVRVGIRQLDVGHWLRLDPDGRATSRRWWSPPPASTPLPEAADAVRHALDEAVSLRVRGQGTVSADLSGGLDSTSLCFLAAAAGADLITCHVTPLDQVNEDNAWAELAAAHLPSARHWIIPAGRPENWFDAALTPEGCPPEVEGPPFWASGRAHVRDLTAKVAAEGSSRHLIGLGGDELFGLMPAYLWSLWREQPVRSIPAINRRRLLNRWGLTTTVRRLADRCTFAASLVAAADTLTAPVRSDRPYDMGWITGLRMPMWATREATETVRRLLREKAAERPAPLDDDRTRHQILNSVVFEGTTVRQLNAAIVNTAVTWEAPLLDDRVLEATLSLRIADRSSPTRFKPLLAEAVRDLVPAPILARNTKGEFSAEMYEGLKRNRDRLMELCTNSRLAALGLIDANVFRTALLDPGPMSQNLPPIQTTVACECWLRSADAATTPQPSDPAGGARLCIPSPAM